MSINRGILAAAAAMTLAAGAAVAVDSEVSSADLWIQKAGNGFTVE